MSTIFRHMTWQWVSGKNCHWTRLTWDRSWLTFPFGTTNPRAGNNRIKFIKKSHSRNIFYFRCQQYRSLRCQMLAPKSWYIFSTTNPNMECCFRTGIRQLEFIIYSMLILRFNSTMVIPLVSSIQCQLHSKIWNHFRYFGGHGWSRWLY